MDTDTLTQALWPQGNGPDCPQAYALLDGARDKAIAPMVWQSGLPSACLFAGALSPALKQAAPYLVHLAPESSLFKTLLESGWGRAWGVYAVARPDVTLQALRRHFRTLLRAQDAQGRLLAFRFYDPRVLRVYLPACQPVDMARLFGPVQTLLCEDGLTPEQPQQQSLLRHEAPGTRRQDHQPGRKPDEMLLISQAQMAAFEASSWGRFVEGLFAQARNTLPEACANSADADLTRFLDAAAREGQGQGLVLPGELAAWCLAALARRGKQLSAMES